MSRISYLTCAFVLAMFLPLTSSAQKLDTKSLIQILSNQGFSGTLKGKIMFKFLGNMKCDAEALRVYYYTWEETNPPGRAIHFSQRLIFIQNRSYLGQYVIEDRPVLIGQDLLRFPYSKADGNTIQCDRDGLPESVNLNGDYTPLER